MSNQQKTQRHFPLHTLEQAPEASQGALKWYQEHFGMVPHLARMMSEAPALLNSYWQTQLNLLSQSTLSKQEINIVQTVVAHDNACQYCVAGHTAFGKQPVFENRDEDMEAIRTGASFDDEKLNVLRDFTLAVMHKQGRIPDNTLGGFLKAGYTRAQALDVVACVSAKVMSNYANQLALTPIDEAFAPLAEGLPYADARKVLAA